MSIAQVQQTSDQATRPWFTDVNLSGEGMTLSVGGTVYVAGTAYTLSAGIAITAPASGVEHHRLYIRTDGTLILDPGPSPSVPLYGIICWFDVPASTTDLAALTINQLIHIPEV